MNNEIIMRIPLRIPSDTFGSAFESIDIELDNVQTIYFMFLSGMPVEGESGNATITIDAIKEDDTVVSGIKFLKKQEELIRYDEIESDTISIEEGPIWREYKLTGRMLSKLGTNKIRFNVSAITDSETKYCLIAEGVNLRYASEKPFEDEEE